MLSLHSLYNLGLRKHAFNPSVRIKTAWTFLILFLLIQIHVKGETLNGKISRCSKTRQYGENNLVFLFMNLLVLIIKCRRTSLTHMYLMTSLQQKIQVFSSQKEYHINNIVAKLSKSAGILYIRNGILHPPSPARLDYYYKFVYPYLIYNVIVWINSNEIHLNPLVIQHKRIIRTICNNFKFDHTTPLFHRLNLLIFSDIYMYIHFSCVCTKY